MTKLPDNLSRSEAGNLSLLQTPTPKSLGYRMPAEWEPHAATWLSFPHNGESWPGKLPAAQRAYAKMVASLSQSEPVHLNVNDAAMEDHARRLFDAAGARGEIYFHHFPTNDAWCRDHGAIFLVKNPPPSLRRSERCSVEQTTARPTQDDDTQPLLRKGNSAIALDWRYNAWGEKYLPFDLDNLIPLHMANTLGILRLPIEAVLEGGSIDVNGQGLLLTTESCLLHPNRNPDLTREAIEHLLCESLGVEKILWLADGIAGDDTDGHIDDLARFVAPNTVVTVVEENPQDDNYRPLQENLTRLQVMRNLSEESLEILQLPMPPAVYFQGQRLPASYANFYIANKIVLLPTFACDTDTRAIDILASVFPNRRIVGVDCRELVWGLGTCHCLTQQVPQTLTI